MQLSFNFSHLLLLLHTVPRQRFGIENTPMQPTSHNRKEPLFIIFQRTYRVIQLRSVLHDHNALRRKPAHHCPPNLSYVFQIFVARLEIVQIQLVLDETTLYKPIPWTPSIFDANDLY